MTRLCGGMEINVTKFVTEECRMDYSASVAEVGPSAGQDTWRASCEYAEDNPILTTPGMLEGALAHFLDYGAWEESELDDATLQGLTVQEIASAMGEMEHFDTYEEYQHAAEDGQVSGRLYKGDIVGEESFGQFYLYLGC